MSAGDTTFGHASCPVTWVCPETHRVLVANDGILVANGGDSAYEVVEGIPIFTGGERDRRRAERHTPALDELLRRMRDSSCEEAAAWFCGQHGCTREPHAADWKQLFAPPPRGTILELGAGFGDDSITLAADPLRSVLVVPTLINARILRWHLEEQTGRIWPVAVLPSLERLPLPDDSVGAIILEEAALASFGISEQNFPRVVAEWKRVLSVEGIVFLGLSNALHRLPGLASLRARLVAPATDSMNRTLKRIQGVSGDGRIGMGSAVHELRRQGFGDSAVYAPLPSEKQTDLVLPVRDRVATAYFLDHLVRTNSPLTRVALGAARLALKLGWFPRLVPYLYLFFTSPGAPSRRGPEPS